MSNFVVQICAIFAIMALPLLGVAAVPASLGQGDIALVVSGLASSPEAIITKAGLDLIGPETAPFGAFTQINTQNDIGALREAGALLVLNGQKVLELCR